MNKIKEKIKGMTVKSFFVSMFEFYNKNQNALAMLRGMLFERKALDAMLTHVKTKEKKVNADDLFKQASVK